MSHSIPSASPSTRAWRPRRRLLAASSLAAVAIAGSLAAYAQLTGSSGAPAAALAGSLAITSPALGPLSPQINPSDTTPVTVTLDLSGSASRYVGAITGVVQTTGTCLASWFTVAPIPAPGVLSPGVHTFSSSVILNDNDRDQSSCLSQTVTIAWSAASS